MKKYNIFFIVILLLSLLYASPALAKVEWQVQSTLNLEKSPQDMTMSARGTMMFVLTDDGIVHVYNSDGILQGEIEVGKHIDSIIAGPKENTLILRSEKEKTVQSILVEFVHEINIEDSPYRGKEDAPVVIVVFTDYQ